MGLFQKSIEPRAPTAPTAGRRERGRSSVPRRGVMAAGSHCRSFKYDPLRRVPPRPAKLAGMELGDEDFKL